MSGNEFADKMLDQILAQGAEIEFETVISVTEEDGKKVVSTEEGSRFEAKTVILATGVKHRMLGLPGEEELVGDGISFCAVCDGDFYAGQSVCMAGGGNSALQEAILLSDKCTKVTILQDLPFLTGEESLQKILRSRDNVEMLSSCVSSILKRSSWNHYEIIIVENNSVSEETFAWYREICEKESRVRVIRFDRPFNFSLLVNEGVMNSSGDYIILMNNDVTVTYQLTCRYEPGGGSAERQRSDGSLPDGEKKRVPQRGGLQSGTGRGPERRGFLSAAAGTGIPQCV